MENHPVVSLPKRIRNTLSRYIEYYTFQLNEYWLTHAFHSKSPISNIKRHQQHTHNWQIILLLSNLINLWIQNNSKITENFFFTTKKRLIHNIQSKWDKIKKIPSRVLNNRTGKMPWTNEKKGSTYSYIFYD